ncbi:hypothetical protein OROGR_005367 [Orobanche gracilis]
MTGKKNSKSQPATIGYISVCGWAHVPSSSSSKAVVSYGGGGGKRNHSDAFESQSTTKAMYKSPAGSSAAKFTKTEKSGGFVDKRSGNHGYKQEVKYKTAVKVKDVVQGATTEYETQVKFKKTTTYHSPKKASSGYRSVTY